MNNLKTTPPFPEELYPTKDFKVTDNHNIPREVFRNNTTAVEVIVKQVGNKNKTNPLVNKNTNDELHNLYADIDILQNEVINVKRHLEETKKCFQIVLYEFKKQLEVANQRDLRRQTKNVLMQLEKEKLKTLLDSKSNLVVKLKKELLGMRRLLKFVIKGIQYAPEIDSDCDYGEFERELKRCASLKNTKAFDLDCLTFDSLL
ncbi:unnamed protein product [Pieris brassicae]|uniref:Uncharacterized protein n=1 Tax=Pieris brassicae TaxID=7116 RepID=A0A9P0TMH3_PIEBR|nr:unnamed protein product [Pieris brassicae]